MRSSKRSFAHVLVALFFVGASTMMSHASTITLNPVDDGSIYTCTTCNHDPSHVYLLVSGYIVGEVDFSTAPFNGQVATAFLSVNAYGLPLWGAQIDVYGRASTSSTISISDLSSPIYLGTWSLPTGLGYGQDAFFDVTTFLQSVQTPYVDFILKDASKDGNGTDVFSSTANNYGHPAQLTVSTVPEPATWSLLLAGLIPPAMRLLKSQNR